MLNRRSFQTEMNIRTPIFSGMGGAAYCEVQRSYFLHSLASMRSPRLHRKQETRKKICRSASCVHLSFARYFMYFFPGFLQALLHILILYVPVKKHPWHMRL